MARDNAGNLIANQNISVRFSIYDATAGGTVVYKETQSVTTNALGLFTANIGQGTVVTGTFSTINWGGGSKFTQVEMDAAGGTTYVDMGTQQMLSVPYALYSGVSGNGWALTGNVGTTAANFIGTTDNMPFNFKVNNQKAGTIDPVSGNAAIGYRSLLNNTTGGSNIAIGMDALHNNTSGSGNTAIGQEALRDNTTASVNTAVGIGTLTSNTVGDGNTAIGNGALGNNTTGHSNTATGIAALQNNISGNGNEALGDRALYSNTSGNNNIAIGGSALYYNTTGYDNNAIGNAALNANTSGVGNVALSDGALTANTTGIFNTATGLTGLSGNTIGNYNTASGYRSLESNVSGSNNTAMGYGTNVTSGNLSNATAIGANAIVGASNSLVLGNNANVGIGTSTPTAKLDIAGNIKITDGTQGANKVLTSNATGVATWQTPATLTETDPKVGTLITNNIPKWNGATLADGIMYDNGTNVGIFLTTPQDRLDVYGGSGGIRVEGYGINGNGLRMVNTNGSTQTWLAQALGTSGFFGPSKGFAISDITNGKNPLLIETNTPNNTLYLKNTGSIGIGTTSPSSKLEVAGGDAKINGLTVGLGAGSVSSNTANGYQALYSNTTGYNNSANGYQALFNNTTGTNNTATGNNALFNNTTGYQNTSTGSNTLYQNTTGYYNTAHGQNSLYANTTGNQNTASGVSALSANTTGNDNTANGLNALAQNTTGSANTASGVTALYSNTTGGSNTASGPQALYSNIIGNNNTAIGYSADVLSGSLSNATAIGYNAKVGTSNSLVLGGTGIDAVNVGIGVTSPTAKLEVNGQVKITGGIPGANKILTSDAVGLASWQTPTVPQDEIVVVTQNGFGSVNTSILRFSTILSNTGTAMTYTDSPTDGATVTINTSGIYYLRFTVKSVWDNNQSCYVALLKNTGIDPGINSLNQLSYSHNYESTSTTYPSVYSTVYLLMGDVVRPWGTLSAGNEARFEIRRVH